MDPIDRQLIDILQRDGRISNRDLARAVNLSPSACLARVRSLQDRGIIIGYRAQIDPRALDRGQEAILSVRFRPHSRAVIDAFERYIISLPEIVGIAHTAGVDDLLVMVAVKDVASLRTFTLDHITVRKEVVAVNTSVIFNQIRKQVLEPLD